MKQNLKNEAEVLNLINAIQSQLVSMDKKIDTLINRNLPPTKPTPPVHKERMMHSAICADCQKECQIPFKPSGDRPVYCQDCFSRRKVISMSGIKLDKAPIVIPEPQIKEKKPVTVKKPIAKKKPVPKKK